MIDRWMDKKRKERRLNWTLLRQQISHRCRLQGSDGEHAHTDTQSNSQSLNSYAKYQLMIFKCLREGHAS